MTKNSRIRCAASPSVTSVTRAGENKLIDGNEIYLRWDLSVDYGCKFLNWHWETVFFYHCYLRIGSNFIIYSLCWNISLTAAILTGLALWNKVLGLNVSACVTCVATFLIYTQIVNFCFGNIIWFFLWRFYLLL